MKNYYCTNCRRQLFILQPEQRCPNCGNLLNMTQKQIKENISDGWGIIFGGIVMSLVSIYSHSVSNGMWRLFFIIAVICFISGILTILKFKNKISAGWGGIFAGICFSTFSRYSAININPWLVSLISAVIAIICFIGGIRTILKFKKWRKK